MTEYKAVIYQEGMLGSLLLGQSKVNPVRFSEFLNANATVLLAESWALGQTLPREDEVSHQFAMFLYPFHHSPFLCY